MTWGAGRLPACLMLCFLVTQEVQRTQEVDPWNLWKDLLFLYCYALFPLFAQDLLDPWENPRRLHEPNNLTDGESPLNAEVLEQIQTTAFLYTNRNQLENLQEEEKKIQCMSRKQGKYIKWTSPEICDTHMKKKIKFYWRTHKLLDVKT